MKQKAKIICAYFEKNIRSQIAVDIEINGKRYGGYLPRIKSMEK